MTPHTCAGCGRPFEGKRFQSYCTRDCWRRTLAGPDLDSNDRAAARARLRDAFGTLSDRDQALFRTAYDLGYRRGFDRGYDARPVGPDAAPRFLRSTARTVTA